MQAVLGDRKKYLRKLKEFQRDFYEKISLNKGGVVFEPAEEKQSEEPVKINLNSSDDDSDNSIDRLNGYIEQL